MRLVDQDESVRAKLDRIMTYCTLIGVQLDEREIDAALKRNRPEDALSSVYRRISALDDRDSE